MSEVVRNNMAKALFWLRIPFTYGNVRRERQEDDVVSLQRSSELSGVVECTELEEEEEEEETERVGKKEIGEFAESTHFDGLISSIQMLISFVVMASVFILPSYTTNENATYGKLLLIVLMGIALLLMICIHRCKGTFLQPETPPRGERGQGNHRSDRDSLTPRGERGQGNHHSDRDSLTLIGIVTFCALGCLYNFAKFLDVISCSAEWIVCQSVVQKQIVRVVFRAVRVVYLAGQTVFCLAFNRSTFSDRSLTRHALMYLQAVNVIFWFQTMISEAEHLLNNKTDEQRLNHLVEACHNNANGTTNQTTVHLQCLGDDNAMHRFVHHYAIPILRPFLIEYSLLIGECLTHWFISCGEGSTATDQKNDRVVRRMGHPLTAAEDDNRGDIANRSRSPMEENNSAVVVSTGSGDSGISNSNQSSLYDGDERTPLLSDRSPLLLLMPADRSRPLSLILWIGLAVISNILLFVFAFLPKLLHDVGDKSLDRLLDKSYYHYTILYYSLMIIFVALGYGFSSRFKVKSPSPPFTGIDYLLIFTSLGPLAIGAFKLQATMWAKKPLGNPALIGAYRTSIVLEVVQSAFQLSFVLYAGRIAVEKRRDTLTRRNIFRGIVFCLAMCNGSLWCTNTFCVGSFGKHYLAGYFGETGRIIILIVLAPLSLFFRFNSCLLFARIFCETRSKHQKRQETGE